MSLRIRYRTLMLPPDKTTIIDEHAPACTTSARLGRNIQASANQHRVAVTVKAVAGFNRMAIGAQDVLLPRKRPHQRKQTRLRQVKIREQLIYDAESLARVQKYFRFGFSRCEGSLAPGAFLRCVFKRSHDRGPHG